MGEAIGEIGYDVPPMKWTREQALAVATAAVDGFLAKDIPF